MLSRRILIVSVVVQLCIGIGGLSYSFSKPQNEPQKTENNCRDQQANKNCQNQPLSTLNVIFDWFGNRTVEQITAAATVAIAIFTIVLGIGTVLLVADGRKHSQRQLRAYVHVKNIEPIFANDRGLAPNIRIEFKNYGQTPAYRVRNRSQISAFLAGEPRLTAPEVFRYSDLGPSQDLVTTIIISRTNWEFIRPAARLGASIVYVIGEITYFDAFQRQSSSEPHSTNYCFRVDIDDAGSVGFPIAEEGNYSN